MKNYAFKNVHYMTLERVSDDDDEVGGGGNGGITNMTLGATSRALILM